LVIDEATNLMQEIAVDPFGCCDKDAFISCPESFSLAGLCFFPAIGLESSSG